MWLHHWSFARYHLHLSDKEFYALTPRQFHALKARRTEEVEHRELLAGIVASNVVNFSMGGVKNPTKPKDFMPSQWVAKATRKKPSINRRSVSNSIRGFLQGQFAVQQHREH